MVKNEVVTFSDLASELKINRSKTMHYEKLGLIVPQAIIDSSGTKLFNKTETLSRLRKIIAFRKKGYTLEEIKALL